MSSKRPHVDPAVVAVVRAWAGAADLDAAARILADGRRTLAPALQGQLRQEVAEINAHTLLEVMTLERGVTAGETVDIGGVQLHPKQVERVSAWRLDQAPTAEALGVELERWHQQVLDGMEVVVAERSDRPVSATTPTTATGAGDRAAMARALLGAPPAAFEARPGPASQRAGLSGLLAARAFARGDDDA